MDASYLHKIGAILQTIQLKNHRVYYNKMMVLMVTQPKSSYNMKLGVVFQGLKLDMEKWLPSN
jgi:hypothetical protein